jgi:hypothetical protein
VSSTAIEERIGNLRTSSADIKTNGLVPPVELKGAFGLRKVVLKSSFFLEELFRFVESSK